MKYDSTSFAFDLHTTLASIQAMLLAKNKAYGDSALNPLRILSKSSAEEQILVRIDDKLSRLARGAEAGEDSINDLLGYFVLLKILRARSATSAKAALRLRNPRAVDRRQRPSTSAAATRRRKTARRRPPSP